MRRYLGLAGVIVGVLGSSVGYCGDWWQWRGPNRDAKSSETGLLKKWPEGGPKLLWAVEGLGKGFSTVAVADGAIYTTGMMENGEGVLFVYDFAGKPKWKQIFGPDWNKSRPGTRGTPTVDANRVYVMSGLGKLSCFDAGTGEPKWSVDTVKGFKGKIPKWGIAESVLIDGNNVICTPGGPDASIVAFDKLTGKTVWQTKGFSEASAYCSPMIIERGGTRLILTMTARAIVAVQSQSGNVLWHQPHITKYPIHPNTPIYHDGMIYATSGYGAGGQMVKLSPDGTSVTAVWTDKKLDCHHGGVVLINGYIYGTNFKGALVCLELASGKVMYTAEGVGKGSVVYADGMIYCYSEKGTVGLINPSGEKCEVVSTFKVTRGSGQHWAHPVIANGRLYIRHGNALMAYEIKAR